MLHDWSTDIQPNTTKYQIKQKLKTKKSEFSHQTFWGMFLGCFVQHLGFNPFMYNLVALWLVLDYKTFLSQER